MLQVAGIELEWLARPTGDPFADAGGYVLEQFWEKHPDKDLLGLIREAANIYVKNWNNNLHSFFLNSTITHNSNKGQKGIDKTLSYFQNLLKDKEPHQEGYCRITGQKTKLFFAGRDNHIMSGSGTLINFHHAFQTGILLSKEVLIRIFFVPLGLVQLGNKVALIHSNDEEVTRFFVKQNLSENFREIGSGASKSILKSEFNNPANALFDFAEKCIANLKVAASDRADSSRNRGITLNLYHFSNFGASPEIKLYTLPAVVFAFYVYCLRGEHKKDWKRFVNNYYRSSKFKDAHFNEEAETWENKKEAVGFDEFKAWRNVVFEKLLSGESLLREFLFWSKKNAFPFHIVEQYQYALRNMDKRTLQKIKELADFIMQQDKDFIKKSIRQLNSMKSSFSIRQFLLNLIAKNHKDGNEILITLEEYVEYLFPDGASWREIRDLLLIAIYQKLHETKTTLDLELPEPDLEPESETINE
jgi:CRISPR-associated protein Cst1